MPEISQAWLALIGALLGGSGLKFIEHYLSRPKDKEESATAFRNELRTDVKDLREEIRKERASGEEWRAKYYAQVEADFATKKELLDALGRVTELEDDIRDWKNKYYQLWEDMVIERDAKTVTEPLPNPGSIEQVDADPHV